MNATHRRTFLKQSGVAAVTVAVPAWIWGCAATPAPQTETPSEAPPAGSDAAAATPTPETPAAPTRNEAWEAKAAELEKPGVLTAAAPGKWAEKAGTHVPKVAFAEGGVANVETPHGMSADHYITVQYLRDQNGIVIAMHEFQGTDPAAKSSFTLPPGTTQVTAYSHCNKHDHWSADSAAVA